MNLKVGINSPQIKEFGGEIDACKVNIIELALDKVNFLVVSNLRLKFSSD